MADPYLDLRGLAMRYGEGAQAVSALESIDLAIAEREFVTIVGPSGCGKSTLLYLVAGFLRPTSGSIRLRGRPIAGPGPDRGIVFQRYSLFPWLTVRGNIGFGATAAGTGERAARVADLVRLLGLDGLARRRPQQLSAGQRQRVALGRALARGPRLLLLDEPLSALDMPTREAMRADLRRVIRESGVPAIVVTHDRTEALTIGDVVGVMVDGSMRQVGAVVDVFDRPATEDGARVVGVETVHGATVVDSADGLLRLRVGSAELAAVGTQAIGTSVLVSIRAEDVVLLGEPTGAVGIAVSARNRLPGRVIAIEPAGALMRVRIDCGFPLVAAVTRPALEELHLQAGATVVTVIKAPAVNVIA